MRRLSQSNHGVLPSVPDPRSCIGSLSALRPVHDLIANDVVAQQSVGLLRRVPVIRNTSKTRLICVNFVNCICTIELKDLCELVCVMVYGL